MSKEDLERLKGKLRIYCVLHGKKIEEVVHMGECHRCKKFDKTMNKCTRPDNIRVLIIERGCELLYEMSLDEALKYKITGHCCEWIKHV